MLSRKLDLQAKVTLILVAVIVPTFLLVTVAANAITRPWLENEIKQLAVSVGQTLAVEVANSKWLQLPDPSPFVERRVQELIYQQPNIVRLEVYIPGDLSQGPYAPIRLIASNVEEDPLLRPRLANWVESPQAEIVEDDEEAEEVEEEEGRDIFLAGC